VRAIKNDPTKNVSTREVRCRGLACGRAAGAGADRRRSRALQVVRLKQLLTHWKEKAGEQGGEEVEDITDARQVAAARDEVCEQRRQATTKRSAGRTEVSS
jgi:hypothetical protein